MGLHNTCTAEVEAAVNRPPLKQLSCKNKDIDKLVEEVLHFDLPVSQECLLADKQPQLAASLLQQL